MSAAQENAQRGHRKERVGLVVGTSMDKTITVVIEGTREHALYKKGTKRSKKLKAHDEQNACGVGDRVRIQETRPLSKTKRWRLVEIVQKAV